MMSTRSAALALAVGILAALLAPATRSVAASIPFTATLSFEINGVQPITMSGSGIAVVNTAGGSTHIDSLSLAAGAIGTVGLVVPITDPAVWPINGLQLTAENGPGVFMGGGGVMSVAGVAKVCLFGPCPAPIANLSVPLSVVGVGGTATAVGIINATVAGAPWTTGTAVIGTPTSPITRMGFRHGPLGNSSSTAEPSGALQLVTPIFISTSIGSSAVVPAFAILTLHFVPEPGTVLLIGGGLAVIGLAGRRLRTRDQLH